MPARSASRPTMSWSSGALARVTGSALCIRSATLSEFHQAKALVPIAKTSAISIPPVPPIR